MSFFSTVLVKYGGLLGAVLGRVGCGLDVRPSLYQEVRYLGGKLEVEVEEVKEGVEEEEEEEAEQQQHLEEPAAAGEGLLRLSFKVRALGVVPPSRTRLPREDN